MRKILLFLLICLCPLWVCGQNLLAKAALNGLVENTFRRQLYALAREQIVPLELQNSIIYSLAQVHRPGSDNVLGTAWLTKRGDEYFAVMPYHVGGKKGAKRELTFYTYYKQLKKLAVTIDANGSSGYHSPDVSLVRLPPEYVEGNIPLETAEPNLSQPAYSFGYTAGRFSVKDFFPMQRTFLSREGIGLTTDRNVFMESQNGQALNLSGYCGAPLLQKIDGRWKVVAMHSGSIVSSEKNFFQNRSFAVSIEKAMNILIYEMNHPDHSKRALLFKGQEVSRLAPNERVQKVVIQRGDETIFEQEMRFFPYPYSDKHAEKAFVKAPLIKPNDVLKFYIVDDKHQVRLETYFVF